MNMTSPPVTNEAKAPTSRFGLSEKVNELLEGKSHIKLLEAGCGSFSHINVKPFVKSVGIDISQDQLDRNTDLHEKILGDIQTYPLPEDEFDVVVCWYVLEHLPKPKDALRSMFKTVKPGGLLILTFPNILSLKGIVTKCTPHWFHKLTYRIMKFEMRPFQTYCRWAILPKRIMQLGAANGFSVAHWRMMEDEVTQRVRERFWIMRALFATANTATRVLSFGKCKSLHFDNCELILRKNPMKRP